MRHAHPVTGWRVVASSIARATQPDRRELTKRGMIGWLVAFAALWAGLEFLFAVLRQMP